MVVCNECIKNVLSRIYLESIAYYGKAPQLYWDAIQALEKLDKSCLTVNSTSDSNCPLGWRRNNYPILTVGKKNNKLKFSYTKKQLNNGELLIIVEEVADAYGNILTENKVKKSNTMKTKKVIRLTESDLHNIISESVKSVLTELDWKTYANAARKQYGKAYGDDPYNTPMDNEYLRKINRGDRFKRAAEKRFNDEFGYSDPNNEEAYRLDINGECLIGPTSCAWDRTREAPYPVRKTFGGYRDAFGNSQYRTCELDPSTSSDNLRTAKERGDAELDKYYRGGYRYTKYKGWH